MWTPTAALRNGDFSAFSQNITIYDPLTRTGTGGQLRDSRSPATSSRRAGSARSRGRCSSSTRCCKGPGLTGNIFDATLPETAIWHLDDGPRRPEGLEREPVVRAGATTSATATTTTTWATGSPRNFQFISYQGVIDDVHVFNPTTVLNVRYGYNRFERNSGQQPEYVSDFDLTRLTSSQYNNLVPATNRGFPRIEFPNTVGTAFGNDFRPITTHSVAATLNKTQGAHSLKSGLELRIYREDSLPTGNARSRPLRLQQHLHAPEQREWHGTSRACRATRVPARAAVDAGDLAPGGLLRVLEDVRPLRAGRLARQQQADAEPGPALGGRDAARGAQRQERLRLRLRLRPADPVVGATALRRAQRPGAQGAGAAAERDRWPAVRGEGRRQRLYGTPRTSSCRASGSRISGIPRP